MTKQIEGQQGFPKDLLEKSIEDRVHYFEEYTVAHPHLEEAYKKMMDNISGSSNRTIKFLYGPSGVGKTTIYKKVKKTIVERLLPTLEYDKGRIPFAGIEAVASDNGIFDWKDFYIRLLEEFKEIAIDYKIDYETLYGQSEAKHIRYEDPNRKLRKAVESTLKNRRPMSLIIDEAQHMMRLPSGRKLKQQMDSIKSLASLSNTPIVLIGTYDLLHFTNLSGQLSRRSDDVHFERYNIENKEHMQIFENVLYMFQKHLPLENEPDLISDTDFFYERCIGCIGTLKDWLTKTLEMKLLQKRTSLTTDDFLEYALSFDQCIKMINEARNGEMKLQDDDEKKRTLYSLLMPNSTFDESEEEQEVKDKGNKKNRIPGKRKPKRDVVGIDLKEEESDAV